MNWDSVKEVRYFIKWATTMHIACCSSSLLHILTGQQIVILTVTVRLDLFAMSVKAVIMAAFQRALAMPTQLALEMTIFASHGRVRTRSSAFTRTKLAVIPLVEAFFQFHVVLEIAILVSDITFRFRALSFHLTGISSCACVRY